jgi:hypothetical protein
MTLTVAQLAQAMQTLLTADAEQAARDAAFVKRKRQLTGPAFAQALVFGWMAKPDATLENLAVTAAAAGADVTAQAVDRRFGPAAADCLRRLLQRGLRYAWDAQPATGPLLRRFHGVYLLDSTVVALPVALAQLWPGCGGRGDDAACQAALKVQVRWELTSATLEGLSLHAGKESEARGPLSHADLPAGSLRLADLGYFDLDTFAAYGRQKVWWLSRLQPKTAVFVGGRRLTSVADWLRQQKAARLDVAVELGARRRLGCRLVAARVPAAVARKRRARLRKKASKKGRAPSAEQLALCAWDLLVTNLPVAKASLAEVLVLGRCRWQVELLFKLWKSHARLDESRSGKPYRVLCEVYGKLLALLVGHWVLLGWAGSRPDRSLFKAAQVVQQQALPLLHALGRPRVLRQVLRRLGRLLGRRCRVNKRRHKPATFQLVSQVTERPAGQQAAAAA